MAVVVYECDTCKREVHRSQNTRGLDVIGHCVITDGCRGKLNQKQIKPSHAVGHSTPPILGLKDWTARRILHTHNQELARQRWQIDHGLNGLPIVNAYVYKQDSSGDLLAIEPDEINYVNNNTVTLSFRTTVAGKAQLIMRSSVTDQQITSLKPKTIEATYDANRFVLAEAFPLTNGPETFGELTIATRIESIIASGFDPYSEIILQPHYLSPSTLEILPATPPLVFKAVNNLPLDTASSPWAGVTKVVIQGNQYLLRSANIHSAAGTLPSLGIPEGAPVFFTVTHKGIVRTLAKGEMLGLLANAPFLTIDRILNQYIDLSAITQSTAPRQLVYNELNWRMNPSLLIKTYPDIITL